MKKIASILALMVLLTGLVGTSASAAKYKVCPRTSCTTTRTHKHSGKTYAGHHSKDGHKHSDSHGSSHHSGGHH